MFRIKIWHTLLCQRQNVIAVSSTNIILPFLSYHDLKWTGLALTALLKWLIADRLELSAPQSLLYWGCLRWGNSCCHSLIEWWLSWTEPPVFCLCENMLMQIDANDVVLYMQISHATTPLAFVVRGQMNPCDCVLLSCLCAYPYIGVYVWCVCVKQLLPQG